jgi:hypothetical protein
MVANNPRSPTGSLALAGLGAAAFGGGLVWRIPVQLGGIPLEPVPVAGALLMLLGLSTSAVHLRRPDEPEPAVPAHVAFLAPRGTRAESPPSAPGASPAKAAAVAHAPPAAPVAREALPPAADAAPTLDEEIRDLTKQINRAGVMLATGRLSDEGYRQAVRDLKQRRGRLEADRAAVELGR